jgi:hypothetical protein
MCGKPYHVRCAVRVGMIKDWEKMEARMEKASDTWFIPVFCDKHEVIGT